MTVSWLTTEEAAKLMGVSVWTLRALVNAGKLPCIKITCRLWRFRKEDIERYGEKKAR